MDALDIRIIRAMGLLPFGPSPKGPDALKPGHIADELGVTAETVRERVRAMEKSGVIRGYQVYPNFLHLGVEAGAFLFEVEDDERLDRLPKQLGPLDGLIEVSYFLGPNVCVDLSYRSDAERKRKLEFLMEFTGDEAPHPFYLRDMPPVQRDLSGLDWRILRAMRGRARRPLVEVADELGVGYRTVKRHHDRMAAEGSFFAVPLLDPGKGEGLLPGALLFYLRPGAGPATLNAIRAAFEDELAFGIVPRSKELGNLDVMVFSRSPAHVEELRRRGTTITGVERVRALILREITDHTGWIDDVIETRIRETAASGA